MEAVAAVHEVFASVRAAKIIDDFTAADADAFHGDLSSALAAREGEVRSGSARRAEARALGERLGLTLAHQATVVGSFAEVDAVFDALHEAIGDDDLDRGWTSALPNVARRLLRDESSNLPVVMEQHVAPYLASAADADVAWGPWQSGLTTKVQRLTLMFHALLEGREAYQHAKARLAPSLDAPVEWRVKEVREDLATHAAYLALLEDLRPVKVASFRTAAPVRGAEGPVAVAATEVDPRLSGSARQEQAAVAGARARRGAQPSAIGAVASGREAAPAGPSFAARSAAKPAPGPNRLLSRVRQVVRGLV